MSAPAREELLPCRNIVGILEREDASSARSSDGSCPGCARTQKSRNDSSLFNLSFRIGRDQASGFEAVKRNGPKKFGPEVSSQEGGGETAALSRWPCGATRSLPPPGSACFTPSFSPAPTLLSPPSCPSSCRSTVTCITEVCDLMRPAPLSENVPARTAE